MRISAAVTLIGLGVAISSGIPGSLAACPAGLRSMGTAGDGWTVCEDLSRRDGRVEFHGPGGSVTSLRKTAVPMFVDESSCYVGYNKSAVMSSTADIMAARLIELANGSDVSLADVSAAVPPFVYDGGYNMKDPAHSTGKPWAPPGGNGWNVHTWTGSRGSSVKMCFDTLGSEVTMTGSPDMNQYPGKYHRSTATFKDALNLTATREGLWGDHLPIIAYYYTMSAGGWIEWTAVPVPDMAGNYEQDMFYRVLKVQPDGTVTVRYFDTYAYRGLDGRGPGQPNPGMGSDENSEMAQDFYSTVTAQQRYWDRTLEAEGVMDFILPQRTDTDGKLLNDQARHSLIRTMITRNNMWFPAYGTLPNEYGFPHNNACDLTTVFDLLHSLEIGAFEYAKGILDNFLNFYVYKYGIRYSEPSAVWNGRHLSMFAQYWSYTGDPTGLLLKYQSKILVLVNQLRAIRARALQLPKQHLAYGMPSGQDNADTTGSGVECGTTFNGKNPGDCHTDLPFVQVATEMERGFRDLGAAWQAIGAQHSATDLVTEGKQLVTEAEELHTDLMLALERNAIHDGNSTCYPYVFGWTKCSGREPGYVYPTLDMFMEDWGTVLWSRVLPPNITKDITVSGAGLNSPGQSFTGTYGLLVYKDDVEHALISLYSASAHAQTRGTWTAAEVPVFDRTQPGTGYTPSTQVYVPTALKWHFVIEDTANTLWFGKGIPRQWLSPGERVGVSRTPTSYGRVSLLVTAGQGEVTANITLPSPFRWPAGGLKLRLRCPGFPLGARLSNATVGGKPWPYVNPEEETVVFATAMSDLSVLQQIAVTLK